MSISHITPDYVSNMVYNLPRAILTKNLPSILTRELFETDRERFQTCTDIVLDRILVRAWGNDGNFADGLNESDYISNTCESLAHILDITKFNLDDISERITSLYFLVDLFKADIIKNDKFLRSELLSYIGPQQFSIDLGLVQSNILNACMITEVIKELPRIMRSYTDADRDREGLLGLFDGVVYAMAEKAKEAELTKEEAVQLSYILAHQKLDFYPNGVWCGVCYPDSEYMSKIQDIVVKHINEAELVSFIKLMDITEDTIKYDTWYHIISKSRTIDAVPITFEYT